MSLLAYNLTTSPIVLSDLTTLPPSPTAGTPGPAFNVTAELMRLTGVQYIALQALINSNSIALVWTSLPEFNMPGVTPQVVIATNVILSNSTPSAVGAAQAGLANETSRSDHVHAHGTQIGGTLHAEATGSSAGFLSATDKAKLDSLGVGSLVTPTNVVTALAGATGDISVNSHKITDLATPSASMDAANKAYVDATAQGLSPKTSVRAATTTPISNLSSAPVTQDGVVLVAGDRLLVKDTASADGIEVAGAKRNGIYVVGVVSGSNAPLTRATDADTATKLAGAYVFVENGSANSAAGYVLPLSAGEITLGTTSLNWTQFSGAGEIIAGSGILKTGNTLSLSNTSVVAGSYTTANIVVDAQGRITTAASGTSGPTFSMPFTVGDTFYASGASSVRLLPVVLGLFLVVGRQSLVCCYCFPISTLHSKLPVHLVFCCRQGMGSHGVQVLCELRGGCGILFRMQADPAAVALVVHSLAGSCCAQPLRGFWRLLGLGLGAKPL